MMHAHKGVFWGIDKYPFGYKAAQIFPVLTPLILIKEICFLILNCPSFENDAISRFFSLCHGMFFWKAKKKNTFVSGNAGDEKNLPGGSKFVFLINLIEFLK